MTPEHLARKWCPAKSLAPHDENDCEICESIYSAVREAVEAFRELHKAVRAWRSAARLRLQHGRASQVEINLEKAIRALEP